MTATLYGSLLAASEVGIGSLAHALQIPLRGHLLSINQLFILNVAFLQHEFQEKPSLLIRVTHIAAAAKALTPTYKRITPILALYAQTLLFYGPVILLRGSALGKIIGCVLSSVWAVLQGIISLYIVFGNNLIAAIDTLSFFNLSAKNTCIVVGLLITLKIAAAISTIFIAKRITVEQLDRYNRLLSLFPSPPTKKEAIWRDLCSLSFLLPLSFILLGLMLQGGSCETLLLFIVRAQAITAIFSLISTRWLLPWVKQYITQ